MNFQGEKFVKIQQISLQWVKITCSSTVITYTGVQIAFSIKNTDKK